MISSSIDSSPAAALSVREREVWWRSDVVPERWAVGGVISMRLRISFDDETIVCWDVTGSTRGLMMAPARSAACSALRGCETTK